MKQLFHSLDSFVLRFPVCSLSKSIAKYSRCLFLLLLISATILNSSFRGLLPQPTFMQVSHSKPLVPFKGKLYITSLGAAVTGTGEGTHIGRFDFLAVGDETTHTGTDTFTAANGDQIFATHAVTNIEDLGNGTLELTLENTITGGSGRFSEATGNFTIISTVNVNTGKGTATFDGSIGF